MTGSSSNLRPREFALLLLAAGDVLPRRRARDQQADRAGLELKRRLLEELLKRDPDPDSLPSVLMQIVEELGPPQGPSRSMAMIVMQEWQMAQQTPEWLLQLFDSSQMPRSGGMRIGQQLPG